MPKTLLPHFMASLSAHQRLPGKPHFRSHRAAQSILICHTAQKVQTLLLDQAIASLVAFNFYFEKCIRHCCGLFKMAEISFLKPITLVTHQWCQSPDHCNVCNPPTLLFSIWKNRAVFWNPLKKLVAEKWHCIPGTFFSVENHKNINGACNMGGNAA